MVDQRSDQDGDLPGGESLAVDLPTADLRRSGLLSFYDRLRGRMRAYCDRRAGRLGAACIEALLLVPDIFVLLVRLSLDKEVPKEYRTLIASTLAYFILPFDLFPEGLIGPLGFMDDLLLAAGVLATAFGGGLAPYAARHWSGGRGLLEVLADITATANAFLGDNTAARVQGALARFGVVLEDEVDLAASRSSSGPTAVPDPVDGAREPFPPTGPVIT